MEGVPYVGWSLEEGGIAAWASPIDSFKHLDGRNQV